MRLKRSFFVKSLLAGLVVAVFIPAASLSANTVAHYRFEEGTDGAAATGALDSSGNNYHLEVLVAGAASPVYRADVPMSPILAIDEDNEFSIDFAGANVAFHSIDDEGLSNVEFDDFTIELWVKFESLEPAWQTIVGRSDRGNQNNDNHGLFRIQKVDSNNFGVLTTHRETGAVQFLTTSHVFTTDTWTHLAVVGDVDAGTITAYADGQQVGVMGNYAGLFLPNPRPEWTIGTGQWIGSRENFFNGRVDEVRFSNVALSPQEFLTGDPEIFEFVAHPEPAFARPGYDVSFSGAVEVGLNFETVSYQWELSTDGGENWTEIEGETETTLFLENVALTDDRNQYRLVVEANGMTLESNAAELRVGDADGPPETEGVVAYYRFEGGTPGSEIGEAFDSVGGHHLPAVGTPLYGDSVPFALLPLSGAENLGAVELGVEENNAFVGTDGDSLSQIEFESFTVEAWVQFDQLTNPDWQIVVGRDDRPGPGAESYTGDANPLFRIQKVAGNNFVATALTSQGNHITAGGSTPVVTNRWYHVAAVGDAEAGTLSIYVDGELDGQTGNFSGLFVPQDPVTPWTIGRGQWADAGGPVDWVNGRIDEVRFSDRALARHELLAFNTSVVRFVSHPQDATAFATDTVVFSAFATGGGVDTPGYQWQVLTDDGATWTDIDGANEPDYTIESVILSQDGHRFRVIASQTDGAEEISDVATLSVPGYPEPQIVSAPPAGLLAFAGDHIVLNVEATGQGNITYQWSRDGVDLGGETGFSLDLGAVEIEDEGTYAVVVIDDAAESEGLPPTTVTLQTELILIPRPSEAISLNFVGSARPDWAGALDLFNGELGIVHPWQEAGVVPVANWNNSPSVNTRTQPFELVNDLGEPTGVTATWESANTWGALNGFGPVAEKDADQRMFHGYIEGRGGSSVTISNIEFATYDVFVYPRGVDGAHGQNARRITLTDAEGAQTTFYGRSYIPAAPFNFPFSIASAMTEEEAAQSEPVTVFRYAGVTGSNFTILHEDVVANPGGIAAISIVDTSAGTVARPVFTSRPVSRFAPAGSSVTYSVEANSAVGGNLSYQWRGPDGTNIAGANSATLQLDDVSAADSGTYTVVVNDSAGSTNEAHASLSVAGGGRSILVSGDMNHILLDLHDEMSGHGILRTDGTVIEVDPATAAQNPHGIGEGDTVWNRMAEWARGLRDFTDLVDHEGLQLPGLTLSIDAPAATAQDTPTGGGIDDPVTDWSGPLLRDYIFTESGDSMNFTLSGLTQFAGLEVTLVVYSHGPESTFDQSHERDDIATVTLAAANSTTGEAQSGVTDASEGRDLRYNNFAHVVFEDAMVAANGTVSWTISEAPGVEGLNAFNGFQILLTGEGELIPPGEGIADWRQEYFGTSANDGDAANDVEFTGDGFKNLVKYALGVDPTVAGSAHGAIQVGQEDDFLTLTFNHIADPNVVYSILATNDLNDGFEVVYSFPPFNSAGVETYTDDVPIGSGPQRFISLGVSINE